MKLKNIFLNTMALVGGLLATSSCNDFLDMKPLDQVTPPIRWPHTVFLSITVCFLRIVDIVPVP